MLLTGVCGESFVPGVVLVGCAGRVFRGTAAGRTAVGEYFRGRAAARSHRERVYARPQSLRRPLISRGQISHAIPLKVFQVMKPNR